MVRRIGCMALAMLAACTSAGSAAAAPGEARLIELARQDAELADVCCIGSQHAWAVGDRGVIWHTADGGRSWKLQQSHVRCRLNAVVFLDERHGWAAGGWTQAYTHLPRGVVLRTTNGGATWTPLRAGLLPTLSGIRFFDGQHGVAFGRASALFPSGVFTTEDGGKTWIPVPAEAPGAWTAADFVDPYTGALAGRDGVWATLRRRSLALAPGSGTGTSAGLRSIERMKLLDPTGGWMVGEGGLVLTTGDLGQSWQTAAPLPDGAAAYFDLDALAVAGGTCWVAGAPGTRVFASADGGRSWNATSTGCRTPIHALALSPDGRQGWAVGALGIILHSADGGKTWQRQRAGGTRAALLGLYSDPASVPLELLAQLAAADGYLTVVDILGRRDLDPQSHESPDALQRTHEALLEVGACGAETSWRFPLRQDGLTFSVEQLVAMLDRVHDARGLQTIERYLVRQLRTWRPEVVVTHAPSPRGDRPLGHLVNQLVLRAVAEAADPTSHVELATAAGLEPWKVRKVYGTLEPGQSAATSLDTARLEPRLGCSTADFAADARGLVTSEYAPAPSLWGFSLLIDHVPQNRGEGDFFSGIALDPGGEARRMLLEPAADTLENLRRMAQKRRNMQALIEHSHARPEVNAAWLGQLGDVVRGLEPGSACQVLYQLGEQYYRTGRWEMASAAFEALVERQPEHPLAQAAQLWLIQYYASGEAAWRCGRQSQVVVQQVTAEVPLNEPANATLGHLKTQATQGLVGNLDRESQERFQKASRLAAQVERTQPDLIAQPALRFPLACAHRRLGLTGEAERFFLSLRRTRTHDAWWAAATGEEWIGDAKGEPPKSICTVKKAAAKPHLDGQLDEELWQAAHAVALTSLLRDDGGWPAQALLAYDGEFLYIGLRCHKPSSADSRAAVPAKRTRDPDLSGQDRVDLMIDIDRDYATYYRLSIDERGQTGEACWGDATWNPTWYVAWHDAGAEWTAEAAIAFAELTSRPPQSGHIWALGLQRTVPGVGFQSWTQPAAIHVVPEGFGYLVFQ